MYRVGQIISTTATPPYMYVADIFSSEEMIRDEVNFTWTYTYLDFYSILITDIFI